MEDFEVFVVTEREQLDTAPPPRSEIVCLPRGWFENVASAMETDRFAGRAGQVLLTRRSTGRVLGTAQVLALSPADPSAALPTQRACLPDTLRMLSPGAIGEIRRFAISKHLSDAGGLDQAMLQLGLLQGILWLSADMGLTHWYAVMEHRLARRLRRSGIHFQPAGPALEHYGLRQPCWARIASMLERIRRERPAVWDYWTLGGTLWCEAAAEAVVA
ncbi:MAG TPA: acyl-homoserine-lactone synthase [Acetobacteraceae bacterium]|nr:acyl-homoserine-lactone synthase [Acetobacteraceae bacterium]